MAEKKQNTLFSKSYCSILGANFLLFFAFYLLMPVMPFYLKEHFLADNDLIGIILACYTVATLAIRPFAGYLLDTLSRKPLYLITFFLFTITFGGYPMAMSLFAMTIFRAIHGLSFGIVTVAGNTIVIDILPSERRGEGLGYYGLSNNIAMAFGPMVGLFLHKWYSFETIFMISIASGFLGLALASIVKSPYKAPQQRPKISLDRFFLIKGLPSGVALALLSVPYSIVTTYIAIYATELRITLSSGLFFTSMALGMMISRLFSGRAVDRGYVTQMITLGMCIAIACYLSLGFSRYIPSEMLWAANTVFFSTAFLIGAGYGIMFPAFNSLFVSLARHDQRGTATSTYLTSWDLGIGCGIVLGGVVSNITSFGVAYLIGGALCAVSTIFFVSYAGPHFERNKIE